MFLAINESCDYSLMQMMCGNESRYKKSAVIQKGNHYCILYVLYLKYLGVLLLQKCFRHLEGGSKADQVWEREVPVTIIMHAMLNNLYIIIACINVPTRKSFVLVQDELIATNL